MPSASEISLYVILRAMFKSEPIIVPTLVLIHFKAFYKHSACRMFTGEQPVG